MNNRRWIVAATAVIGMICAVLILRTTLQQADADTKSESRQKPMRFERAVNPEGRSTMDVIKFLETARKKGLLPGSEDVGRRLYFHWQSSTNFPISRVFVLRTTNGSFASHYEVVRNSSNSPWEIKNAWRTDKKGKTVETYPVPSITSDSFKTNSIH